MPFEERGEHSQYAKTDEPDGKPSSIDTVEPPGLGIGNGERRYHAASIQPQKALRRQLEKDVLVGCAVVITLAASIRISNHEHK